MTRSDQIVRQYEFFTYQGHSFIGDTRIENAVYLGMFGGKTPEEALDKLVEFCGRNGWNVTEAICREVGHKTFHFKVEQ